MIRPEDIERIRAGYGLFNEQQKVDEEFFAALECLDRSRES